MKYLDVTNRHVNAELSQVQKRIRQIRLRRFLKHNDPKFITQEMVAKSNDEKIAEEWISSGSHRYLKFKAFNSERTTRSRK